MVKKYVITFLLVLISNGGAIAQGTWSSEIDSGYFFGGVCLSAIPTKEEIYVLGFDSLQILNTFSHDWITPPEASSYLPITDYANAGVGFEMGTACELNGKIYTFGGFHYDDSSNSWNPNTLHVFDPTSNAWSEPKASGDFIPREDVLGAVVNGKIYAIGGNTGYLNTFPQYFSTVEIFDPNTKIWTTPITNGSLIPGIGQTASVVNGKIYVIGGIAYDTNALPTPQNQMFDPLTNTWSIISSDGFEQRWYHTASVFDGKIYIIGGATLSGIVPHPDGDTLQIYDPSTDTWSTPIVSGTFTQRSMLASAVLGGKIYAIGGRISHNVTNIVEVFTPGSSTVVRKDNCWSVCLSPNPTSGSITIRGAADGVYVMNVLGQRVASSENPVSSSEELHLDLSRLPTGTYFARIPTSTGITMRKILKE